MGVRVEGSPLQEFDLADLRPGNAGIITGGEDHRASGGHVVMCIGDHEYINLHEKTRFSYRHDCGRLRFRNFAAGERLVITND